MSFSDTIWNDEFRSNSWGLSEVSSYIDDILVYNDSWEEHLRTLKELFGRLRRARITARSTKCLLIANRMELLGHQ